LPRSGSITAGVLKDRHADTVQYLTIHHGPAPRLEPQFHFAALSRAGCLPLLVAGHQGPTAFASRCANSTPTTPHGPTAAAATVARDGLPNYFDDQRFGSVGDGVEFVAKTRWCSGGSKRALKLALTAPYEFDPGEERNAIKATLIEFWGRWPECKEQLPRSHARSLVDYLVHHPTDFRGTLARMRPELQGMYLSAYQSYLWNRILAEWLVERVPAEKVRPLQLAGRRASPRRWT